MKVKYFVIAAIVIIYSSWFRNSTYVANDLLYVSTKDSQIQLDLPMLWVANGNFALGENFSWGLTSWPLNFLYGLLSGFNIPHNITLHLLFLIPFLLFSFFGIKSLLNLFKVSGPSFYFSYLFYISNTYVLLLVDGGQLNYALAYATFPLVLTFLIRAILTNQPKDIIWAQVLLIIISFTDIRILYVLVIPIFFYILSQVYVGNKVIFTRSLTQGIFYTCLLLGIHSYWIVPYVAHNFTDPSLLYKGFSSPDQLSFVTLQHAFLVYQPHWYENVFGRLSVIKAEFYLVPLIIYFTIYIYKKTQELKYWFLIIIVGIFLAKGSNPPFGEVYALLFSYLPGFNFFRDSSKFFILVILGYSFFIGLFFSRLDLQKKYFRISNLISLVFVVYIVFISSPVIFGRTTGIFSTYPHLKDFLVVNNYLESLEGYSKIVWLPSRFPLGYSSPLHPAIEATKLLEFRPFAVGAIGRYDSLNFFREASFTGELLDILGVSHIVYVPLDPRRDDMGRDHVEYHKVFLDQILQTNWSSGLESGNIVPLVKNTNYQSLFFSTNTYFVVGSDEIYKEATKSSNLKLSNNSLVLVDQYLGTIEQIERYPEAKIVLHKKENLDLVFSYLTEDQIIFPAKLINNQSDRNGWWKSDITDVISWREFLLQKYSIDNYDFDLGGGWIISENEDAIDIGDKSLVSGKVLYARVLRSPKSGSLVFKQNDKIVGEINTINDDDNISWHKVGFLNNSENVEVVSQGQINIVNALVAVDEGEYKKLEDKIDNLRFGNKIVEYNETIPLAHKPSITYLKVNATKYHLQISGMISPQTIVFAQKFDPSWKIGNQSPTMVYSMLNGFRIEKDGEYILEYEPQKYIYYGLFFSGLTFLCFIYIIFNFVYRRKIGYNKL